MERCDMPSTFHFFTRYLCIMTQRYLLLPSFAAKLPVGLKKETKTPTNVTLCFVQFHIFTFIGAADSLGRALCVFWVGGMLVRESL